MNEIQYKDFIKRMVGIAGIKSTLSRRADHEMRYYLHHKTHGGQKLRGKYRP